MFKRMLLAVTFIAALGAASLVASSKATANGWMAATVVTAIQPLTTRPTPTMAMATATRRASRTIRGRTRFTIAASTAAITATTTASHSRSASSEH